MSFRIMSDLDTYSDLLTYPFTYCCYLIPFSNSETFFRGTTVPVHRHPTHPQPSSPDVATTADPLPRFKHKACGRLKPLPTLMLAPRASPFHPHACPKCEAESMFFFPTVATPHLLARARLLCHHPPSLPPSLDKCKRRVLLHQHPSLVALPCHHPHLRPSHCICTEFFPRPLQYE
jgi:hypothetical protein